MYELLNRHVNLDIICEEANRNVMARFMLGREIPSLIIESGPMVQSLYTMMSVDKAAANAKEGKEGSDVEMVDAEMGDDPFT